MKFQPAKGSERFAAWFLDFVFCFSVITTLHRLTMWLWPVYGEVRVAPMQLYTTRDWDAFVFFTSISLAFLPIYHMVLPLTRMRATLGPWCLGLRLCRPNGEALTWATSLWRTIGALVKFAVVVFVGPVFALFDWPIVGSIAGLGVAIYVFVVLPITAWMQPDGAGVWERWLRYRVARAELKSQA